MTPAPMQTVSAARTRRTPRVRMIAYTAFSACALGYAGFVAVIFALKAEVITTASAIALGGVFAVIGEAGLWVGAASLGLGLYTRRKEKIARFIGTVRKAINR